MGEFRCLETVDAGGIDPVFQEQGFEHLPGGRSALPVDETYVATRQILEGQDSFGVALGDQKPLFQIGEMNQAMFFTRQEAEIKLQHAVFIDIDRQMEAGNFTIALGQGGQRFHAVLVTQFDGQFLTVDVLHQGGDGKAVTGAKPYGPVVAQYAFRQFGFQLGRKRFQRRGKPGGDTSFGPQQGGGKTGQCCTASTVFFE